MTDKKFDKLIKKSLSVDVLRFVVYQELRAFYKECQCQACIAETVARQMTPQQAKYYLGQANGYNGMARSLEKRMKELAMEELK